MKFSLGNKPYAVLGGKEFNVFEWHGKIRRALVGVNAWTDPATAPEEWTPHIVAMLAEAGVEADDAAAYEFALSVLNDFISVKKNIEQRVNSLSGAARIPLDLPADCPTGSG